MPPIPVQRIKALHRKRDFGGIVKLIRSTMNVDVRLTIHWTGGPPPKEIPNAPAWIRLPEKMPSYGTPAFKELKLDMFVMKSFAETKSYDQFAMVIAHELSHVVLESIKHPLRKEEKAVDLTAMILGFSYLYRTAAHTVRQVGYNQMQHSQIGYLSKRELSAACRILVPHKLRVRHATLNFLRASRGVLILVGLCAGVWIIETISIKWEAHKIVVQEQAQVATQIPIQYNNWSMTLIGVHAGLTSLTKIFSVDRPLGTAFESGLRKVVCDAKSANISKGVSYIYEYQRVSGDPIARYTIDSCP